MTSFRIKNQEYELRPNLLKYFLLTSKSVFFSTLKEHVLEGSDWNRHRIFIDNKADVLFVAHLDTVQTPSFDKIKKGKIYGAGFDDRLGVMTAMHLVTVYGLKADILITDHEEKGKSTAQYHDLKEYNWIAEFDRMGGDVVTYDRDSKEFLKSIKTHFKRTGRGSFTDICMMETESCCMNIGIGYKFAHGVRSEVDIKEYLSQVNRFIAFYKDFKDTKFKITNPQGKNARGSYRMNYSNNYYCHNQYSGRYYDWKSKKWVDKKPKSLVCDFCKIEDKTARKYGEHTVCRDCLENVLNSYKRWITPYTQDELDYYQGYTGL